MFEARFQSFDLEETQPAQTAARVAALRAELARRGLDGFVLPRADKQQNEYVPPSEERLKWLTGFSGSAGVAVVLKDRAALFVDGRYTLQARDQVDAATFSIEHLFDSPPHDWLENNLKPDTKLGYDPWLHTAAGAEKLAKAASAAGATLSATEPNPIDGILKDRPAPPLAPVALHDLRFSGESATAKLARIQAEIGKAKADALVVSDAQAVAWTFNIRGGDVAHTPLPLAFALVPREGRPSLYMEPRNVGNAVRHVLEDLAEVREETALAKDLAALGGAGKRVRIDETTAADALAKILAGSGAELLRGPDPIALMKAVKNATEIEGARAAHRRDGAALARFLAWFDREAPGGKLGEIDAVAALESFRRDSGALKDISFPTIAGAGPNGAIVHYRVTRASNRRIAPGELFLVDSGAQFEDGTTDVTRTPARYFPRARPARSSTASLASTCGPPGSISITVPATGSAAICPCTRGRHASPSSAPQRSSAA